MARRAGAAHPRGGIMPGGGPRGGERRSYGGERRSYSGGGGPRRSPARSTLAPPQLNPAASQQPAESWLLLLARLPTAETGARLPVLLRC